MIPAVCSVCRYTFPSGFSLGGSRNSSVTGCSTTCPKCGGHAPVMDSFTDSSGGLHIQGFFNHLQKFKDQKKLVALQANIESANDSITAVELSEALVELDPSFSQFSQVITSIPPSAIKYFINILMGIITLVIAYQTWQSADENHDETIQLQRDQLELSREEFDHKKEQERKRESEEKHKIEEQINQLRLEFEAKLREVESKQNRYRETSRIQEKVHLKGNQRNKPCPCGSGIKSKRCHPHGFVT